MLLMLYTRGTSREACHIDPAASFMPDSGYREAKRTMALLAKFDAIELPVANGMPRTIGRRKRRRVAAEPGPSLKRVTGRKPPSPVVPG